MDAEQIQNGHARSERIPARQAARCAMDGLEELLGRSCEAITSIVPSDHGWEATLEVLELERVPNTMDILGSYVVELDERGELLSYERTRRYARSQTSGPSDD